MPDARQAAIEDIRHHYVPEFYAKQAPLVELRMTHFAREVIVSEPASNGFKSDGTQLCYSSVHKSQLDYIILGYQLHNHGYPSPRYIAGKNLFLPGISREYLKKCGAICLDRERMFKRDRVYIRAFSEYVRDHVLGGGENLLFFPEGGRSYDGSVGSPATGIYDSILDAVQATDRPMLVVPLAMTYDGVVEAASFPILSNTRKFKRMWLKKLVYYFVDVGQILGHYFMASCFCGDIYLDIQAPFDPRDYVGKPRAKVRLAQDVLAAQRSAVRVTARALLSTSLPTPQGGDRAETESRLDDRLNEVRERGLPITRTVALMLEPGRDRDRVLRALVRRAGGNVRIVGDRIEVRRPAIASYYGNTVAHHFDPTTSR